MDITKGAQEHQHHYFMCFSPQHVPIHFSDLAPAPACSEAEGYRDKVCQLLHTICILQRPVRPPSTFGLSWAGVLTLHTPAQWFTREINVLSGRGVSQPLRVQYSRDWIPLAALSIRQGKCSQKPLYLNNVFKQKYIGRQCEFLRDDSSM